LTESASKSLAWVTGAGGLIGNYLVRTAPQFAPAWRVRGFARAQLDLLDFSAVHRAFHKEPPQLIIHCAAMSRSPDCQANPEIARRINVEATAVLADLAENASFVFLSSDLVFDGHKGNYVETDSVEPLSVYAETKVSAERSVLANPRHIVIRTSLNGGTSLTGNRGFNEQMRLAWQAGRTLKFFEDEFRSPIPAVVTARAIWELVNVNQPGVFHVAGAERLSRLQMGQLMAARWPQLQPKFEVASARAYSGAPRPLDSSLNCAKAQKLLSFPLPGLTEWLAANPGEVF
jgi:dTDP-4-dehydrorhamnose reductase